MLLKLPLKKLVTELRYKADLSFYSKMDAVGLELAEDFPNWERSPLTVEIRNRKRHRRLFLSHNRSFYDADEADADGEFAVAERYLKRVCTSLSIETFRRIGVRQWFAADLNKPFALMVDQIAQRFLAQNEELAGILTDNTHDVAYVVDYQTTEGWRYNLRLGPMMKEQYFQVVGHETNNFEQSEEGGETFEQYRATFPEQFLFIDLDCYQEDYPANKLDKFLASVRRKSHDLASRLIDFCKR